MVMVQSGFILVDIANIGVAGVGGCTKLSKCWRDKIFFFFFSVQWCFKDILICGCMLFALFWMGDGIAAFYYLFVNFLLSFFFLYRLRNHFFHGHHRATVVWISTPIIVSILKEPNECSDFMCSISFLPKYA